MAFSRSAWRDASAPDIRCRDAAFPRRRRRCARHRAGSPWPALRSARGTVAENISVRRSAGAASRMNSRSSRKPRSSISSASSSTTAFSADMSSEWRVMWSRRRPGVPTTIWAPRSSARRSLRMSMPPTQDGDRGAGQFVEPLQFARHLQGQFARRRDGQRQRAPRRAEALRAAQQGRRQRQAEGHRLARAGLRRDQRVGLADARSEHRLLHRRQFGHNRVFPAPGQAQEQYLRSLSSSSFGIRVLRSPLRSIRSQAMRAAEQTILAVRTSGAALVQGRAIESQTVRRRLTLARKPRKSRSERDRFRCAAF